MANQILEDGIRIRNIRSGKEFDYSWKKLLSKIERQEIFFRILSFKMTIWEINIFIETLERSMKELKQFNIQFHEKIIPILN